MAIKPSILGVIPARYGSTRFPGKPLADIAGQTLIQRVWNQASQAGMLSGCVVATDNQRIYEHVVGFGGQAQMTSSEHASGTDRLGEIAASGSHSYYVNIQGDEPLLSPHAIDDLARQTVDRHAQMSTLVTTLDASCEARALDDPNVVKVVTAADGTALLFSRAHIPYPRNAGHALYRKHIGIYMYSRETLLRLCQLTRCPLEEAESLEQLRALYHGVRILCVETEYDPVSVDTLLDVQRVLERL